MVNYTSCPNIGNNNSQENNFNSQEGNNNKSKDSPRAQTWVKTTTPVIISLEKSKDKSKGNTAHLNSFLNPYLPPKKII